MSYRSDVEITMTKEAFARMKAYALEDDGLRACLEDADITPGRDGNMIFWWENVDWRNYREIDDFLAGLAPEEFFLKMEGEDRDDFRYEGRLIMPGQSVCIPMAFGPGKDMFAELERHMLEFLGPEETERQKREWLERQNQDNAPAM